MADICITAPRFEAAEALRMALADRGLDVSLGFRPTCHTLVQGGPLTDQAALMELARKLGAKRVVVVRQEAEAWAVTETLGGRILHVDLPAGDDGAALLAMADLLASLVQIQMTVVGSHSSRSTQLSVFVKNLHFVCESTHRVSRARIM